MMAERTVRANGIEIWAEDFGEPRNPAVLLVMGAGGQGILWPDEFCAALVAAGFYTIRYDNRDTGQSTCVEFAEAPYTLSDMARDAIAVLDAFGVDRSHVVGASMGGMIGQTLAIEHAGRLRTLTSIMSSPAGAGIMAGLMGQESRLPGPAKKLLDLLSASAANPPRSDEERIGPRSPCGARSPAAASRSTRPRCARARRSSWRAPGTSTRPKTTSWRLRRPPTATRRCARCARRRS